MKKLLLATGVMTTAFFIVATGNPSAATSNPVSLWIGDSYTMGVGSTQPWVSGEAYAASAALGWSLDLDAVGGTGFVVGSKYGISVPGRLRGDAAIRPKPNFVVIDAGRNDYKVPEALEQQAVISYFWKVSRDFPRAKIVVIAPFTMRSTRYDYLPMRCMLDSQARRHGWAYVDPISEGWIGRESAGLVISDGAHPDSLGYAYVVSHLVPSMSRALTRHPARRIPKTCRGKWNSPHVPR